MTNLNCRFVTLQQSILADTKDAVNALVRLTAVHIISLKVTIPVLYKQYYACV